MEYFYVGHTGGLLILLPGNVKFTDIIGVRSDAGTGTGTGAVVRANAETRVEVWTLGAESGIFLHTTFG